MQSSSKRFLWKVNYDEKSCDCRFWDLYGIICSHAIIVFKEQYGNLNSQTMSEKLNKANHKINECWLRKTYQNCYVNGSGIKLVTENLIVNSNIIPQNFDSKQSGPVQSKRYLYFYCYYYTK